MYHQSHEIFLTRIGIRYSSLYIACTNPCVSENMLSRDFKLEKLMSLISSDHLTYQTRDNYWNLSFFYLTLILLRLFQQHYCYNVTGSGVTLPFGAPCSFFAAPTKILLSPKKKKKGRHFFRLLAPLELFVPPNFFSRRPNAKLAEIWYILLLCQKIFRLKNCKFGNMPPP